ncbi:MAG TPA: YetF domain-containing protein [Actinomycetota bacterium]
MAEWMGTSWRVAGFVALSVVGIFAATLIGIRIAGRRTVSQMSAFDFLVTVAIGTIVANTALVQRPSLLEGLVALVTLLLVQIGIALGRRKWAGLRRLVDLPPIVLVRDGRTAERGMRVPHLTRDDMLERLRREGVYGLDEVALLVLEPTGEVTIVTDPSALRSEGLQILRDSAQNAEEADLPEP